MNALLVIMFLGAAPQAAPPQSGAIECEAREAGVRCKDVLTVTPADDAQAGGRPLASSALSGDALRALGSDTRTLIDFAVRSAGASVGTQRIFVDGMPATGNVPAALISRIAVNADPFSVDNAGADQIRIDIDLREPPRRWSFDASGLSLGAGGGDTLSGASPPRSRNFSAGLSGPVPGLPMTFSLHGERYADHRQPVFASPVTGTLSSDPSTSMGTKTGSLTAGVVYAVARGRARVTWFDTSAALTHAGIGALVEGGAGSSIATSTRQLQSSWRLSGTGWISRGGFSWRRNGLDATADSRTPAVVVTNQRVAGGNEIAAQRRHSSGWTAREVFESAGGGRSWMVGAEAGHDAVRDAQQPNPSGRLQLASLDAPTGTWFITHGAVAARTSTLSAALFGQRILADSRRLTLRAGLRADWHDRDGLILSPRMALRTVAPAGLQIAAGAGLFADALNPELLLDVSRRSGSSAQYLVVPDMVSSGVAAAGQSTGLPLSARFVPGFTRRKDVVVRGAVQRRFGRWGIGAEHTWTEGLDLAGSTRVREPGALIDLVASDRRLRRRQTHARTTAAWKHHSLIVHYEHAHSFDDTDGAFSFPERSGGLNDEWGPSAAVARHNVGVVAGLNLPAAVRLSLAFDARSGRPFNILTGADTEGLATYTDRGGSSRNEGAGPSTRNASAYLYRAIELKRFRGVRIDAGVRLENLLNAANVRSVGQVRNSPLFGHALSVAPGRTVRVWVAAGR